MGVSACRMENDPPPPHIMVMGTNNLQSMYAIPLTPTLTLTLTPTLTLCFCTYGEGAGCEMASGPGVMRVEVLTDKNGGVVYWAPCFNHSNPSTRKHHHNNRRLWNIPKFRSP